MVTIAENIQKKSFKIAQWEKANPGMSWGREYPKEEPKIYIPKEMVRSVAYRSLSRISFLILHDFFYKRNMKQINRNKKKIWICENFDSILYPYSEAVEKGISRSQFVRAIDELQRKGFIDIVHQGRGGRKPAKGTGDCTRYRISNRWPLIGTADFKPGTPRMKDTRKGRGFDLIWQDRKRGEAMLKKSQEARSKKL